MGKYDDMIYMSRPLSTHPSMPVADRAKIFQPFAALKGHEELIKEQQKRNEEYWADVNRNGSGNGEEVEEF